MPYAQLLSLGTDAVCGRKERARAETENLLRASADRISPKVLADVYALQGDTDRSIACLEKSAELHEPIILYLKIDRLLDRVRQDPRFVALERRVGLLD